MHATQPPSNGPPSQYSTESRLVPYNPVQQFPPMSSPPVPQTDLTHPMPVNSGQNASFTTYYRRPTVAGTTSLHSAQEGASLQASSSALAGVASRSGSLNQQSGPFHPQAPHQEPRAHGRVASAPSAPSSSSESLASGQMLPPSLSSVVPLPERAPPPGVDATHGPDSTSAAPAPDAKAPSRNDTIKAQVHSHVRIVLNSTRGALTAAYQHQVQSMAQGLERAYVATFATLEAEFFRLNELVQSGNERMDLELQKERDAKDAKYKKLYIEAQKMHSMLQQVQADRSRLAGELERAKTEITQLGADRERMKTENAQLKLQAAQTTRS